MSVVFTGSLSLRQNSSFALADLKQPRCQWQRQMFWFDFTMWNDRLVCIKLCIHKRMSLALTLFLNLITPQASPSQHIFPDPSGIAGLQRLGSSEGRGQGWNVEVWNRKAEHRWSRKPHQKQVRAGVPGQNCLWYCNSIPPSSLQNRNCLLFSQTWQQEVCFLGLSHLRQYSQLGY